MVGIMLSNSGGRLLQISVLSGVGGFWFPQPFSVFSILAGFSFSDDSMFLDILHSLPNFSWG